MQTEISTYIATKVEWARTTKITAGFKLKTILKFETFDPAKLIEALRGAGLGEYSVKTYMIVAADYEEYSLKTGQIKAFMKAKSHMFRNVYKEKTRSITKTQFKDLLDSARDASAFNFLVLTGLCGLRKSEALSVKWSDLEDGFLVVTGKGNKKRLVPFPVIALKETGHSQIVPKFQSTKNLLATCALQVSPHDFRAMFVTRAVNEGILSIKEAAVVAGHESISTTSRYIRTDLNEIASKLTKGMTLDV